MYSHNKICPAYGVPGWETVEWCGTCDYIKRTEHTRIPTCDTCGMREEDVRGWCGTCGSCSQHCEQYIDCPEPEVARGNTA